MNDVRRRAARCLARLLVARMRFDHAEKVAEGLRDDTLQTLPRAILEDTDYFRDALNDILAGGRKVFT
jgi:hypothetical protein